MKYTHTILDSLKPLLQTTIKTADHQGLDEIRISKARAREILHLVLAADKEIEKSYPQPKHFAHLDAIFEGACNVNKVLSK
jgi:hypothetical protein